MKKIDWDKDFVDMKGDIHTRSEIEDWYVLGDAKSKSKYDKSLKEAIENRINNRLNELSYGKKEILERLTKAGVEAESNILNGTLTNLSVILRARPSKLQEYAKKFDEFITNIKYSKRLSSKVVNDKRSNLLNDILDVFNYDTFRDSKLPKLAQMLNIKCCPYCNQHFTLSVEEISYSKKIRKPSINMLAKLQFDHFFDKSSYPILSMSLYNLVPSCPVCNQGKSDNPLSLKFHPYHDDIDAHFNFQLEDPLDILLNSEKSDLFKVSLKPKDSSMKEEVKIFDNTFHISSLYSRHKDVIEEVYARLYTEGYYENVDNFNFLGSDVNLLHSTFGGERVIDRILFGNYRERDNINRRPLVKFMLDVHQQLESYKNKS